MTGWAAWQLTRDLLIAVALLTGYAWLTVLSRRHRLLSKRLDLHTCRSPKPARESTRPDERIPVADLLARERDRSRRYYPTPDHATQTRPGTPVAGADT